VHHHGCCAGLAAGPLRRQAQRSGAQIAGLPARAPQASTPGMSYRAPGRIRGKFPTSRGPPGFGWRYPGGRYFVSTGIVAPDRMREILLDLKNDVAHLSRESSNSKRPFTRESDLRTKQMLREALIDRIFVDPRVEFINSGIWGGKRSPMTSKMSTGQTVALQFMWIIRQAEFEIERGLTELSSAQASKSRARANRMILIDGIFSSLSDRHLIKEAMNGLKDLGGNFQIVGLLHSTTWVNDDSVFPVYHVGYKLGHSTGKSLVVFDNSREAGTLGVFSTFARSLPQRAEA